MRRRLVLILAVTVTASLVGCHPGAEVTPSPTPSASVSTAVSTPTPSATTPSEDELFAEAERVYLAGREVQAKFGLDGDYSEFPPELADYYSPEYLELVRKGYEAMKEKGYHTAGVRPTIVVMPARGMAKDGSEVAVQACQDARQVVVVDGEGLQVGYGQLTYSVNYFKHIDGLLKIFAADVDEVEACPF